MNTAVEKPILCVDLDETLILIDSLYHSMFLLLLKKPWLFPWFCFFLAHNRAGAKAWIAKNISLNPTTFPFRYDLLDYLKKEKAAGRKLYLVSAADQNIVSAFASHAGLFDGSYGSDGVRNLKGANKAAFIRESLSPILCMRVIATLIKKYGNMQRGLFYAAKPLALKKPLAFRLKPFSQKSVFCLFNILLHGIFCRR